MLTSIVKCGSSVGAVILEGIVNDVTASQFFSVLADEVTDVYGRKQQNRQFSLDSPLFCVLDCFHISM